MGTAAWPASVIAQIWGQMEPEQYIRWLELRREQGPDGVRARERAFGQLVRSIRQEMQRGTAPADEPMATLAEQWEGLAQDTYGHDDALRCSMAAAISQVPGSCERLGTDAALLRYVGQALRNDEQDGGALQGLERS